jgi:hypothetical protein
VLVVGERERELFGLELRERGRELPGIKLRERYTHTHTEVGGGGEATSGWRPGGVPRRG